MDRPVGDEHDKQEVQSRCPVCRKASYRDNMIGLCSQTCVAMARLKNFRPTRCLHRSAKIVEYWPSTFLAAKFRCLACGEEAYQPAGCTKVGWGVPEQQINIYARQLAAKMGDSLARANMAGKELLVLE